MLGRIKSKKQTIDTIDKEKQEPITKEDIEEAIKLIEAAHSIKCDFRITICVDVDTLVVNSGSFKGIKLISNKKDGNKISIQYGDMIFNNDVHIDLENITNIIVECKYASRGDTNV